jgi:LacI family transcriptional regulator
LGIVKKNRATIYDIAAKLNISSSTVSRALLDHPKISDAVKQSVIKTAKELQYRKNNIALSLKKGKVNTIGVVIPRIDRSFFAEAVSAIERTASQAGYNVLICQTNEELQLEKTVLNALCNGVVDGLLISIAAEKNDYSHLQKVEDNGIPIVFFDRYPPDAKHKVRLDDYQGARMVVEHLLSQGLKKIFHFSGYLHMKIWADRYRGYMDAMKSHHINVPAAWVFKMTLKENDGLKVAVRLLQKKSIPEGIFSASDYSAFGAMSYFKSKGLRIPQDIAIAGFANEPFTAIIEPTITSVEQHPANMGTKAVQLLIDILKGYTVTSEKIIQPSLIVRESSSLIR